MINYRELLKEYKLTLESDVLDPAFVSKAKDFEQKLAANQLTEEEIKIADDELVELFKTKHDFTEEDSEEIKTANHEREVAEARAAIAESDSTEGLNVLLISYKELPEVHQLIKNKINKLQDIKDKETQREKEESRKRAIQNGTMEIKAAKYEDLQAMGEKYKEFPELVEMINKRHTDEKPGNEEAVLKAKLLSKKQWSYAELQALDIKPTGNDMIVAGVKLEKEYLLAVYQVRK